MSNRSEKRKAEREANNIIEKAKKDMLSWVEDLGRIPTSEEMLAWQTGYLAGINRLATEQETE